MSNEQYDNKDQRNSSGHFNEEPPKHIHSSNIDEVDEDGLEMLQINNGDQYVSSDTMESTNTAQTSEPSTEIHSFSGYLEKCEYLTLLLQKRFKLLKDINNWLNFSKIQTNYEEIMKELLELNKKLNAITENGEYIMRCKPEEVYNKLVANLEEIASRSEENSQEDVENPPPVPKRRESLRISSMPFPYEIVKESNALVEPLPEPEEELEEEITAWDRLVGNYSDDEDQEYDETDEDEAYVSEDSQADYDLD